MFFWVLNTLLCLAKTLKSIGIKENVHTNLLKFCNSIQVHQKIKFKKIFLFPVPHRSYKSPKVPFFNSFLFKPPENNRILWFSGVFRGYKMRTLARKELIKLEVYSSTLLKKDSVKGLEFLRYCKATFRSLFRIQSNILVHSFSMHPFSTP